MEGCVTDNDIQNALQSLPEGLEETFIRILTQIDKRPKLLRTRLQRVLRLVICFEYIEFDSLIRLLNIAEMGDNWDPNKTINDPFNLISGCGQLISTTFSTGRRFVTLTHLTVQQFLTSDPHSFDSTTLPQYHFYPLRDALMETAQIFRKTYQIRGCPSPSLPWYYEMELVEHWRWMLDFEKSTSDFLSTLFNTPLKENARPGPSPVFPNATHVTTINCRFIDVEDEYYILTSSQPSEFSRGPYVLEDVFLRLTEWTSIESVFSIAPCGIHVQDYPRGTTEPVGHPSSRNATQVTVEGIDFIFAKNSNWTIYPGVETIPGVTKTGKWNKSFHSNCTIIGGQFHQLDSYIISLQQPRLTENWMC